MLVARRVRHCLAASHTRALLLAALSMASCDPPEPSGLQLSSTPQHPLSPPTASSREPSAENVNAKSDAAASQAVPTALLVAQDAFERPGCSKLFGRDFFFPPGVLVPAEPPSESDAFLRGWFSDALTRMAEPSLSCRATVNESYRLLGLPTWGTPVSIRVRVSLPEPSVSVAELGGQAGYDLGGISVRAARPIYAAERKQLAEALEAAAFWSTPTLDNERIGADGSYWVLEGRFAERYHVVHRWSPDAGPFRDLALLMMRLGGVRFR